MSDRVVVSCGYSGQKLLISNREGVTLHEVALPFVPSCLAVSASTVAVGGNHSVCLVSVEEGNIIATLPIPSNPWSLAFDEQGKRLACGMRHGLLHSSFLPSCVEV